MSRAAYIVGAASYLPNDPVDNQNIETVLGAFNGVPSRVKRRILQSNGIETRHYALDPETKQPTHSNARLTADAIRSLAAKTELELDRIGLLVCGTSSPDQFVPNHAQMVQGELGAGPFEVVSTAGVCVSGMTAMKYAWTSVLSGQCSHAVATGSELISSALSSRYLDGTTISGEAIDENDQTLPFSTDFLRWMLSDGAGAVQISPEPHARGNISLRIDWIDILSFSHEHDVCMYAGGLKDPTTGKFTGFRELPGSFRSRGADGSFHLNQDARQLNQDIRDVTVTQTLRRSIEKHGLKSQNIDWFLPHYSSQFFRPQVAEGLKMLNFDIPESRWFTNLTRVGNIGSASIYVMIAEMLDKGMIERGQRILCYVPESARYSSSFMHLTAV